MTYPLQAHGLLQQHGTWSLGPLDLLLRPGITGLVGPNGAGKTTLLRAFASVLPVAPGAVQVLGHDLGTRGGRRQARKELGYLPQHVEIPRSATPRQVLHHAAWLRAVPRNQREAAVEMALQQVDLLAVADRRARELSGGTLRRVALAQAVVHRPRVLLLDEPTTGLDPQQRLLFRDALRAFGDEMTVLLSSHLAEDLRSLADRMLILHEGRLVFDGTVGDLEARADGSRHADSPLEQGILSTLSGGAR